MTVQQEFQAVILAAGKGNRMPEITAEKAKCLLPIGNKPLVWYPLYKLQQAGFTDVILIICESHKSEIQATLDKTELEIKIDYVTISDHDDMGTADSLRLINDKLKSDVLVMSCDLVTDVNLAGLFDLFRKHDASICSLLFNPQPIETIVVPGPKTKHKPERDLIGIDAQTKRLVFLASASDFETDVSLSKTLVKKHTNITMHSTLIDAHVYVIKNWIIKYLTHETSISTIKGELLPHIIKKQLSKPTKNNDLNTSIVKPNESNDIFTFIKENELSLMIKEANSYNDHLGDMKSAYHSDLIKCFAYIAKPDCFGVRVNTMPAYWSLNAKIIEKWASLTNNKEMVLKDPKADIKSTQIDDKCFVWDSSVLCEKTSFKNSILGSNTNVNSFSRVFNSIVMNNVVIKERVALENCIVCDGAVIENGCQLKNCIVGSNHTVPELSEFSNEVLTDTDRLMEF